MEQTSDSNDELDKVMKSLVPMTTVIMQNVADLTIAGLTNLCGNYGTVVIASKHKTKPNIGFVKFATESDATNAIQHLNSKLGFGYRATFAYTNKEQYIPAKGKAVQLADDGEDWEQQSVKRRFNIGFMPPIAINFPEREKLCTKTHYKSDVEGPTLRQVDPARFFCIENVMQLVDGEKVPSCDFTKRQQRLEAYCKTSAGGKFHVDGKQFKHSGLTDEERASFGEIKYCIQCGGYGFVYCAQTGRNYCSVQHQKQHTATLNAAISPTEAMISEGGTTGVSHSLTRDQLPNKVNVYITTVLTPDRIFVRSAERTSERFYFQTLGDCDRTYLSAKPATCTGTKLVAGGIYLAPHAASGAYGRVLLMQVGPKESKCVFVEHGTLSYVSNALLRLIDDTELKYRKVQIYKVCVANITDEVGETEKAVTYLNKLRKHPLEMKHRLEEGNMVDVQLRTTGGASVNDTLNSLIRIPPILSAVDHEISIMYKDIILAQPPLGENKRIMIVNRTTIQFDERITWISMDDLPYLQNLQDKLQCYGEKVSSFQRHFTPCMGEMCIVRLLNKWYRGVCHETAGDCKPSIFLCDYGCMVIAGLVQIRKIPAQFATEVRTHDGIVQGMATAKANGLQLNSDFLDIHLPENEPLYADISQEAKTDIDLDDVSEIYNILNMHEFTYFIESFNRNKK